MKELPPIEVFYSSIKKESILDEDYTHAQKVFREFNLSLLGDYHDLYCKTDVLLLTDMFESFRKVCLSQYVLDPCHFYTCPGLSWASLLKMTGVELELLTDIDMILMIEQGTRGGLSQISNRYQKANNPYLADYDPSDTTSYLMFDYFRLFIIATGCPSERRPQKMVSCYGDSARIRDESTENSAWFFKVRGV